MEPCTIADIETEFDSLVDEVAPRQGIDPICSRSEWIIPVAAAFAADAEPRVFTGRSGHLALLEHVTPNGPLLSGFDAVWGFATPLVGREPGPLVDDVAALLTSLDYYALSLSGIDATGPLFAELQRLKPAGFTDTANRCVADIGGGFDTWLGGRSSRFRRSLNAAANRADSRGITIECLRPTTGPETASAIERVLSVEALSWKTDADSGLIDTNLGFFTQAMSRRFAATGGLRVLFAQLDGNEIGYVIGARVGDRYRGFQHSFDKRLPELSIGKLMQFHNFAVLADEGVKTYDMGMHMTYKESYADRVESTITLIFTK